MTNESGRKPALHKKHVARLERELKQTRLIMYTFFGLLGVVVLLLIYGWLDINYLQLNRPVAKVGDVKILVREFEPRVRLARQNLLNQYSQYQQYQQFFGMDLSAQLTGIEQQLASTESVGETALNQLINEEIIRQEAAKRGITVSEEELNEAIQAGFEYFPNGTPTPSATPTEIVLPDNPAGVLDLVTATVPATATLQFTEVPASTEGTPSGTEAATEPTTTPTAAATFTATPTEGPTATPLPTATPFTEEGFQKVLTTTDESLAKFGFDKEYYRNFFEVQLLQKKLTEIVTADVARTEEQVWARHILVADEATAKDLIKQIQAGADFAELARTNSTDVGSGANGGDLGWFSKGAMVAEFETAAFALENSGDFTTEPVQSQFGFHIIQLIAKQERPLTAEQYQQAVDTAFQDWLTAAREDYNVETYDIWKQRVPIEPNFITAATEAAGAQMTAQAAAVSTLEVESDATETPQP